MQGMPEVTIGTTSLIENLDRDYGIKEPYWDPLTCALREKDGGVTSFPVLLPSRLRKG